jgi:protein-tyrosine phosphatase
MLATQVWERLFCGDRNDAEYLVKTNPVGITTVISVCEDRVFRRTPGINYIHVPMVDAMPVTVGQFDAIIDAIAENIRWGKVLIHCDRGVSRSSIMTAAWMHVVGYKTIDAALAEIKRLSPIIRPSSILFKSVKELL